MAESTDIFVTGGPVMYVLAVCSIAAGAIVLERLWYWIRTWRDGLPQRMEQLCQQLILTSTRPGTSGLPKADTAAEQRLCRLFVEQGAREAASFLQAESQRLYARSVKNLSGLDTVISIAPLLGILGTVLGIMKSFHALDFQHMTAPGAVGHGLAEAMITTAVGLAIAVPTLVFYNFFHSLATRHASRLYSASETLQHANLRAPSGVEVA